jgi:hypothetical protein
MSRTSPATTVLTSLSPITRLGRRDRKHSGPSSALIACREQMASALTGPAHWLERQREATVLLQPAFTGVQNAVSPRDSVIREFSLMATDESLAVWGSTRSRPP